MRTKPKIVIVGSLAYDNIITPFASRKNVLGGSASFACAAASFFSPCGMVAVAGTDFSMESIRKLKKFGINLHGLRTAKGKTFRWAGIYEKDFNTRRTLWTKLNVFESFQPELPHDYRRVPFLFLANIAPALQMHVLDQMEDPRFVMADTMDLWINTARADLLKLIRKIDLLLLNDSEAKHLSGENHLISAARKLLNLGPRHLIIKKGEHGSMLVTGNKMFILPAFPLEKVIDPTGAGDSFAGGFIGYLASQKQIAADLRRSSETSFSIMRKAMIHGTIAASFACEDFSIDRLSAISPVQIRQRVDKFMKIIRF